MSWLGYLSLGMLTISLIFLLVSLVLLRMYLSVMDKKDLEEKYRKHRNKGLILGGIGIILIVGALNLTKFF